MATATMEVKEMQNLTLRVKKSAVKKARVLAAERSTSMSALFERGIEELARQDSEYERARKRAFAMMDAGFNFGAVDRLSREELHER